jgi:ubiquinone/menaquinone biosynthesis C-methylase UbiE
MHSSQENKDERVVEAFGNEWGRFTQSELNEAERDAIFRSYFSEFPWEVLPPGATGADLGCGSGRWALCVAPRVGKLHLVDASPVALDIARRNLAGVTNVVFHQATVGDLPFSDDELDFAYSLGVLHHVPDTLAAMTAIAKKLKRGAPFLVYLYYALDNRPLWYRTLWRFSELGRHIVSRLPRRMRFLVADVLAAVVYWPLTRSAHLLDNLGCLPESWPLSAYRHRSYYVIRTDALDRFGTSLEKRFSREQVRQMMEKAGFERVQFSEHVPYWCAVGFKV